MQALSYVSPKALLKALLPGQAPPSGAEGAGAGGEDARLAAFKRYIADKERRGSLEEVPDFPEGLTWLNSSPLKLKRYPPPPSRHLFYIKRKKYAEELGPRGGVGPSRSNIGPGSRGFAL